MPAARRGQRREWLSAMTERAAMTCAHLHDVVAELALGALVGRERAAALAHLERCRHCRQDVGRLMVAGEQLLELLPPARPPAGFQDRVCQRLTALSARR